MFKKWWVNLIVFSLPVWVGLCCGVLAQVFLKADLPVLMQADMGIAAFVGGGVVRSCDVDRAAGLFLHHGKGNDRGRCCPVCQVDIQPVTDQHFGGGGGEILRVEAPVVPDDDPAPGEALFKQVGCKPLRGTAQVVEGVVFSDDSAPAVGAEFDFVCHVWFLREMMTLSL